MSSGVMAADSSKSEIKVVARALPFHMTTEDKLKFVPVTMSTRPDPSAGVELGVKEVRVGA
jgi:hypothetical protein